MPTVKAMTFRAGSGHHETCGARRKYLEKDSRALERVCLNIADPERWDKEMDKTRSVYKLRGCVNYREFIISPDEEDHATREQVRDLALRWARKNFANAEVAIVLHDDNKERLAKGKAGIVHAHVVVNTVNLETGKKVVIKDAAVRKLHNSAQAIANELGLSTLPLYEPGKRLESKQPQRRTQTERRMELRGVDVWKSQVRDMALQALRMSDTPQQFKEALDKADVDVIIERGRLYLADRDNPFMRCRADRLDSSLSAKQLASHFAEREGNMELRESLVKTIKQELVAGDKIHAEMRAYDERCAQKLAEYRAEAKALKGTHIDEFEKCLMPKSNTPAERERMKQVSRAFRNAAEEIRRKYAYIPPSSDSSNRSWNAPQTPEPSRTEPTRSHSRGYSR